MNNAYRVAGLVTVVLCLVCPVLFSQTPGVGPTEAFPIGLLLLSHRAWAIPPVSIRITGQSTHGSITEPIRITATHNEEALVEYSAKKQIFTPALRFEDDGIKVNHPPSPGGFAELDITGLFLMAHLTGRGVTNDPPERATLEGAPVQRIRVRTGRSEVHYRQFLVRDEFNVFVNESGLLAGISREFYKDSPLFNFTLTFTFSDYRDTGGVILPYRIQRYVTGVKVETISIDTYETDIPVSPTLFQPRREQ